jgi:hypothetical protein
MKEVIKLTYGDNVAAKKEVDEGKYDLYRSDSIVLREHWDLLVEPWVKPPQIL